ncbi:hypothetical protein AGMMS49983_06100 [Clostridia bacterium]|nr:hypothetical protein AGMMS49983_06100 [Clostridia bacterium]
MKEERFSSGTAVLITSYVPTYREAVKRLWDDFGGEIEYIGFDGYGLSDDTMMVTDADVIGFAALTDKLSDMANVVLLSPKLSLLDDIAHGVDAEIPAYLVIRSMLWGKNVRVLLDFEPPRIKRNTFFEKIIEDLQTIEAIGIGIMTYNCTSDLEAEGLTLITETDVRVAHKEGRYRIRKAAGAIVTPAARDASKELGLQIE